MSDLMPCRFCGAAPHAWLDDYINGRPTPDPYYIVECENAGCSVHPKVRGIWPYMDEVRSRWNAANVISQGTVQAQIAEVQPDLLEAACIAAHNAYEQAAHEAGWVTNAKSRKPWADVPEANKIAMRAGIAAALALIRKGDQP